MTDKPRTHIRRPFPANDLEDALQLSRAIQDQYNGNPLNRVLLANAIDRKPASSDYKALLSSSGKYGLTTGGERAESIALTDLGAQVTKPRHAVESAAALKKAALEPELLRRIYEKFNNGKFPQGEFFLNVLERDFKVPRERAQECADILLANGLFAGIIQEMQGSHYVILESDPALPSSPEQADDTEVTPASNGAGRVSEPLSRPEVPAEAVPTPPRERFIFIGHGKNRKPVEQLEKVLKQFGIPYKVAVDEPQIARPISVKVAQVMSDCHSAILIFTGDEEFTTAEGEIVMKPSQNVVFELGAASVLYENRVVIFKEEGLDFPTNFSEIGHIPFEKDRLDAKGLDLVKELVAMKLVKVQAA